MARFSITRPFGSWYINDKKRGVAPAKSVTKDEAIELRDLLNREFPVEVEPASPQAHPSIAQVIEACGGERLTIYRWRAHSDAPQSGWGVTLIYVDASCIGSVADTPEAALAKLYSDTAKPAPEPSEPDNYRETASPDAKQAQRDAPNAFGYTQPSEPDPEEVRRELDTTDGNRVIRAAARAWLRNREAAEKEQREHEQFRRDMAAYAEKREERRERIATAVLAGLAAQAGTPAEGRPNAELAVEWADALIRELDRDS